MTKEELFEANDALKIYPQLDIDDILYVAEQNRDFTDSIDWGNTYADLDILLHQRKLI